MGDPLKRSVMRFAKWGLPVLEIVESYKGGSPAIDARQAPLVRGYIIQEPDVTIRHARGNDAALLADLGARTFSETFAPDNTAENMAAYLASSFNLARLTDELADPAATFLIAEVAGVAAGYAKLHTNKPPAEIEGAKPVELVRLYVSREWLGRGVGEALMSACIDKARQAGHETIWLGVWQRNARAQAFYRKWKFRAVGEHPFQLGTDLQTDILMERAI